MPGSVPGAGLNQGNAKPGDRLVLTKPIGFGIAAQAIKQDKLSGDDLEKTLAAMTTLNKGAKDAALTAGARAATDVTGFGLLGHLQHLASASGLAAKIRLRDVPTLDFIRDLAEAGLIPGGSRKNLEYVAPLTRFGGDVAEVDRLILADAQTSGGLLIAVPQDMESSLIAELERNHTPARAVIGELVPGEPGSIEVTSE